MSSPPALLPESESAAACDFAPLAATSEDAADASSVASAALAEQDGAETSPRCDQQTAGAEPTGNTAEASAREASIHYLLLSAIFEIGLAEATPERMLTQLRAFGDADAADSAHGKNLLRHVNETTEANINSANAEYIAPHLHRYRANAANAKRFFIERAAASLVCAASPSDGNHERALAGTDKPRAAITEKKSAASTRRRAATTYVPAATKRRHVALPVAMRPVAMQPALQPELRQQQERYEPVQYAYVTASALLPPPPYAYSDMAPPQAGFSWPQAYGPPVVAMTPHHPAAAGIQQPAMHLVPSARQWAPVQWPAVQAAAQPAYAHYPSERMQ